MRPLLQGMRKLGHGYEGNYGGRRARVPRCRRRDRAQDHDSCRPRRMRRMCRMFQGLPEGLSDSRIGIRIGQHKDQTMTPDVTALLLGRTLDPSACDPFDGHVLACLFAIGVAESTSGSSLAEALGISGKVLRGVIDQYFPARWILWKRLDSIAQYWLKKRSNLCAGCYSVRAPLPLRSVRCWRYLLRAEQCGPTTCGRISGSPTGVSYPRS